MYREERMDSQGAPSWEWHRETQISEEAPGSDEHCICRLCLRPELLQTSALNGVSFAGMGGYKPQPPQSL